MRPRGAGAEQNPVTKGKEETNMLQRTKFLVSLVALAIASSGCAYKYQFQTGLPGSETVVAETQHQSLFGHVSDNVFDLEKACPSGVSEFGSYISFTNWLPAFLTLGLYTPRTAYAVCATGAAR